MGQTSGLNVVTSGNTDHALLTSSASLELLHGPSRASSCSRHGILLKLKALYGSDLARVLLLASS